MPGKSFLRPIFIAAAIIIFAPSILSAGEYGTVVKRDGTKYENVYIVVNHNFKVITVKQEEKEIYMSFSDIDAIYDTAGNDITNMLLGKMSKGETETLKWETETKSKHKGDKAWDAGISLLTTFSVPYDSYYEGTNRGIGFECHYFAAINRDMAVRLIVAKSGMKARKPLRSIVVKLIGGIQYNTYVAQMIPGTSIFYGVFGLGFINHKISLKGRFWDMSRNEAVYIDESSSESDFLLHIGSGLTILISPIFGFDISASFDHVYGTIPGYDSYSSGYIFDLRGGMTILF